MFPALKAEPRLIDDDFPIWHHFFMNFSLLQWQQVLQRSR